jgi:hypothetical protein
VNVSGARCDGTVVPFIRVGRSWWEVKLPPEDPDRLSLACFPVQGDYNARRMATIAEIEKLAQDLKKKGRS